ncbi:Response regulator ArlR [Weeksella virosa]|uniref:response regulator transcription factor n=1 Tax=Weeksella virosa TaxID=1014 RepID=UPI000DFF8794|nr:response regulator transcription factor [Weeksella virosa]SUP54699.1 Response regulator ArlR [Weeksella virosa]
MNALDDGADDYLTKPFHFDELFSRIKALTRRANRLIETTTNLQQFGSLNIDYDQYKVSVNQKEIDLSPTEMKLLLYLIENKDKTVTRMQILNAVWGIQFDNQTNIVDVYISYLRNKIETEDKFIFTVKGFGYLFKHDT